MSPPRSLSVGVAYEFKRRARRSPNLSKSAHLGYLLAGFGGYRYGYGRRGVGSIGIILIIIVVLKLVGRI